MEPTLIQIPETYNYIAVFLTFRCTFNCDYCLNRFNGARPEYAEMPGEKWIMGLNRLTTREDLPVTLQGGEPSLHPDFYRIINGLREDIPVDILTNLDFDTEKFIRCVPPARVRRTAPYASIRVSYHPRRMSLDSLKRKVLKLMDHGYSVGIWGLDHPDHMELNCIAEAEFQREGIDFRLKEFLGYHGEELHGTYTYPEAISGKRGDTVACRTSELILGPDANIYRCHADLYFNREPVGNLLNDDCEIEDRYRECRFFGACNPCDVKLKTNRMQEYGHTSVCITSAKKYLNGCHSGGRRNPVIESSCRVGARHDEKKCHSDGRPNPVSKGYPFGYRIGVRYDVPGILVRETKKWFF